MPTHKDLIVGALKENRAARAGDVPSADLVEDGRLLYNELLDEWNADRRAVYCERYFDFTLVPALSPHTIGPTGSGPAGANPTFVVTLRPVSLKYAALNLGGSPAVYVPIRVRDDAWYARKGLPDLTTSIPSDVYYAPDWQDPENLGTGYGSLYFYGVPDTAYDVRLWMRGLLASIESDDLTDNFSAPQGYYAALRLTLAERWAPSLGQQTSPQTTENARIARERIFGNNDDEPRIATADAGLGDGLGSGSGWSWRTGMPF
jgi:hypothetical protein